MGSSPTPALFARHIPTQLRSIPKLKKPLRGIRFSDLDELHDAMNAEVRRINKNCLETGIRALPRRWERVIESKGDYFEGISNLISNILVMRLLSFFID